MSFLFFFNDTATTEIYTLSLHDALPICAGVGTARPSATVQGAYAPSRGRRHVALGPVGSLRSLEAAPVGHRSEEHTSELQSRLHLVCRLLLEKKKKMSRAH